MMADDSILCGTLQALENLLRDTLIDLGVNFNHTIVYIRKKTKDLKSGDAVVPMGCLKTVESKQIDELLQHIQFAVKQHVQNVSRVSRDSYSMLAFYLDRAKFCKAVMNEIELRGCKYGHKDLCSSKLSQQCHAVVLNCVRDSDGEKGQDTAQTTKRMSSSSSSSTLTDLRIAILQSHVAKLLQANGWTVQSVTDVGQSGDIRHFLTEDQSTAATDPQASESKAETEAVEVESQELIVEKIKQLCQTQQSNEHGDSAGTGKDTCDHSSVTSEDTKHFVLDLKCFIEERKLPVGKEGFDKNLNKVVVIEAGKPTSLLTDAINLKLRLETSSTTDSQVTCCLHIVPRKQTFRQQQVQLLISAISDNHVTQSQLVVSPVSVQSEGATGKTTAQSFCRSRYEQMKEASEMRYGTCEGAEEERRIQLLTDASVKVDILSNAPHNPLKLESGAEDKKPENRLGAFILYNTARLATLIQRYEEGVKQGLYTPLPSVEETDFSLLREEEDWELLYLYLAEFPSVVHQAVESVFSDDGAILAKLHTHKVCNFLAWFTKCLSAHYSRYHVLTGSASHLQPLIHARIHLMKCAHQVLVNGLHLIGVEPLTYL